MMRALALISAVAVGLVGLLAAGTWLVAPAGAKSAVTPVDGTWRGTRQVRIAGTLEGGFTISAAESWMIFGCPVNAGDVLSRYSPTGGSTYALTWLVVWATTTQGQEGVKCENTYEGPKTVTVTRSKSGTMDISGCGDACAASGSTLQLVKATKPATPTKPTTPTTATPPAGKLVVSLWKLPERYGPDANKDGLVDAYTTADQVNPSEWTAQVYVHRPAADCDTGASYSWTIDGVAATLEPAMSAGKNAAAIPCVFTYTHFKGLGLHRVAVTATKDGVVTGAGVGRIELQDLLVVGLGDSNGSGEGNPDITASSRPLWVDPRCNRSHHSYQARTASALEHASDDTSVTFVHLACSGASILEGMIGSYRGINDPGEDWAAALLPQVLQLKNLVGKRPVDAVIVSIGVNDLRFGAIVKRCIEEPSCWATKRLPGAKPTQTVAQAVQGWLGKLPSRYDKLAAALTQAKIPAQRVYITQYFDSLRDERGKICDPLISVATKTRLAFSKQEAEWAYDDFLRPLNAAVANAARKHGWHLVPAPSQFRTHGYCSADSWIVSLSWSAWRQWSLEGAMHATPSGHQAQAVAVVAALKRNGIDGKP